MDDGWKLVEVKPEIVRGPMENGSNGKRSSRRHRADSGSWSWATGTMPTATGNGHHDEAPEPQQDAVSPGRSS